jgi:hypothetical protein
VKSPLARDWQPWTRQVWERDPAVFSELLSTILPDEPYASLAATSILVSAVLTAEQRLAVAMLAVGRLSCKLLPIFERSPRRAGTPAHARWKSPGKRGPRIELSARIGQILARDRSDGRKLVRARVTTAEQVKRADQLIRELPPGDIRHCQPRRPARRAMRSATRGGWTI